MFGLLLAAGTLKAQDTLPVVAKGATLTKVSSQFAFTEGPAVNKKGDIFFTDQPNDKIWKYSTGGQLSLYLDKTGRANGLHFSRKGNLISCSDEKNELWSIAPESKQVTVLLSQVDNKKLNGPNDLWIDTKDGIYFTDPYYQRDYWERKKPEMQGQKVYYLPKGQKTAIVVEDSLKQPNGIVGTPDGKYLYVADIGVGKIFKYSIKADGSLTDKQFFAPNTTDGMTLDNKGNLYLAGNGVSIYSPAGKKLGNIAVPVRWVGNVCFGGKKKDVLFITASESIFTLKMKVKGVE